MELQTPQLSARRQELEALRDGPDGLTRLAQIRYQHLWRRGELGSVSLDADKLIDAILEIEFPPASPPAGVSPQRDSLLARCGQ